MRRLGVHVHDPGPPRLRVARAGMVREHDDAAAGHHAPRLLGEPAAVGSVRQSPAEERPRGRFHRVEGLAVGAPHVGEHAAAMMHHHVEIRGGGSADRKIFSGAGVWRAKRGVSTAVSRRMHSGARRLRRRARSEARHIRNQNVRPAINRRVFTFSPWFQKIWKSAPRRTATLADVPRSTPTPAMPP